MENKYKVQHVLTQILSICVDIQELKDGGYNFLLHNEDLVKDSFAFIEMLELRLHYNIKVKLDYLDNRDSFSVHHVNKEVVMQEEIENLSYLFHKILPVCDYKKFNNQTFQNGAWLKSQVL